MLSTYLSAMHMCNLSLEQTSVTSSSVDGHSVGNTSPGGLTSSTAASAGH